MKKKKIKQVNIDQVINETFSDIEKVKQQKIVNLCVEIIVAYTLNEIYEKGNKISEI